MPACFQSPRMNLPALLTFSFALAWLPLPPVCDAQAPAGEAAIRREVIVFGGTPGGVMAAVAAARHGHTVALVERNNHVGGMISGGLVNPDIGDRTTVGGLAKEFLQRAVQHYADKFGPAYMVLGHAAGDAAHLAIAGRASVQQVDTAKPRDLLRKEGAVLDSALPAKLEPV